MHTKYFGMYIDAKVLFHEHVSPSLNMPSARKVRPFTLKGCRCLPLTLNCNASKMLKLLKKKHTKNDVDSVCINLKDG